MSEPRTSRRLRTQLGRYNQLCSSLQTLQHTEAAILAWAEHDRDAGAGEMYLALYGLLQALVLQQDAVAHLDEALGGPGTAVIQDRNLQEIRSIRNWSVGHPTKVDRHEVISHHQIRRAKLGRGFELVSAFDDGRRQFTFVSLAELIRNQRMALARIMRTISRQLHRADLNKSIEITRRVPYQARGAKKQAVHAANPVPTPVLQKGGDRRKRRVVLPVQQERRKNLLGLKKSAPDEREGARSRRRRKKLEELGATPPGVQTLPRSPREAGAVSGEIRKQGRTVKTARQAAVARRLIVPKRIAA